MYEPYRGRQQSMESRLHWRRRISEALESNAFLLYAQPVIDLKTRQTVQYEVLLRMIGPDGDLVLPTTFLDIAERYGLIAAIDRWVVRQTVALIAERERKGAPLRIAMNVSTRSLADSTFLDVLRGELSTTGIDPSLLVLEITETGAIADMDLARRFVNDVRALGCRLALDDFGSGFASFYHVKHLAVDYLKLDGSFICHLPSDEVDQSLVKAISELARGMGRRTIAEFVGDEETVRLLREFGIDYGQGFYLGEPRPVEEALADADLAAA
jgi:EAL domain-containing protein (putative c-di-GMP-specific phosphodiesterase class I)